MIAVQADGMGGEECGRIVSHALDQVAGADPVALESWDRDEAIVEGDPVVTALLAAIREEGHRAEIGT